MRAPVHLEPIDIYPSLLHFHPRHDFHSIVTFFSQTFSSRHRLPPRTSSYTSYSLATTILNSALYTYWNALPSQPFNGLLSLLCCYTAPMCLPRALIVSRSLHAHLPTYGFVSLRIDIDIPLFCPYHTQLPLCKLDGSCHSCERQWTVGKPRFRIGDQSAGRAGPSRALASNLQ